MTDQASGKRQIPNDLTSPVILGVGRLRPGLWMVFGDTGTIEHPLGFPSPGGGLLPVVRSSTTTECPPPCRAGWNRHGMVVVGDGMVVAAKCSTSSE